MDRDRFDALAKLLAKTGSRRAALGALFGVGLGGAGLEAAGQKKRKRGKNKPARNEPPRVGAERQKKRRRDGSGADAQAGVARCCSNGNCAPGKGKNLGKCCYQNQDLSGKTFQGANLGEANFSGADLTGANLQSANLGKTCFVDADLTGARLGGTNTSTAIFCRTTMPNGSVNDAGCDKGTVCCPTCDADNPCGNGRVCCGGRCIAGDCCDNGAQSTCGAGGICCDNRCVEGDCCATAECPAETCQTKTCRDNRCAYEPVSGEAGPRCQTICCADEAGEPVCCEAGTTTCDARGRCCAPACADKECGEDGCGGMCPPGCPQSQTCADDGQCVVPCGQTTCDPDTEVCCGGAGCVSGICCQLGDACLDGAECCDSSANDTDCVGGVCCVRAGRACQPGQCCGDLTCCGADAASSCVDTSDDPANCGACGNACPDNASCAAGGCACDPGFKPCGALCIPREACCTSGERGCAEPTPTCCVDQGNGVCRDCCGDADCQNPAPVCNAAFVCVPCDPASAPCNQGEICCDGQCYAGECCGAAQCADQTCQDKRCTDDRICAYDDSANGQAGPLCQDSICCSGECCSQPGAVCDANERCCAPDEFGQTCAVGSTSPKCGPVTDNCGRTVDCEPCAERLCQNGTCSGPNNTCAYTPVDDGQPGTLCPAPGFCCDGDECCRQGDVCLADGCCTPTKTTCDAGVDCGDVPDGCGRTINCGGCQNPTPICTASFTCAQCTSDVECGDNSVCCAGECFAGVCCADEDCAPAGNDCVGNDCRCGQGGACQAPTATCCGEAPQGACVNLDTDPANCGACGDPCAAGETCQQGACGAACGATFCLAESEAPDCCGSSCTDLASDPAHCGTCGNTCAFGQVCDGGCACACPVFACFVTEFAIPTAAPSDILAVDVAISPDGGTAYVRTNNYDGRYVAVLAYDARTGALLDSWGEYGSGDGEFQNFGGIAVAADGTVYVTDTGTDRVQYFDPDGAYRGQFGEFGQAPGQFSEPEGVAVVPAGNGNTNAGVVYVADSFNARIQYFSATGVRLGGWGGDGSMVSPTGVAVSPDGTTVYVADSYPGFGDRVLIFTATGEYRGELVGEFNRPRHVAVGPDGTVYVADTFNHRVQAFTAEGQFIAAWGTQGSGEGEFNLPWGMDVAPDGTVYVADARNRRVQAFCVTVP